VDPFRQTKPANGAALKCAHRRERAIYSRLKERDELQEPCTKKEIDRGAETVFAGTSRRRYYGEWRASSQQKAIRMPNLGRLLRSKGRAYCLLTPRSHCTRSSTVRSQA